MLRQSNMRKRHRKELRETRQRLGLSQEQFGQLLGYASPARFHISYLENGVHEIQPRVWLAVAMLERLSRQDIREILTEATGKA